MVSLYRDLLALLVECSVCTFEEFNENLVCRVSSQKYVFQRNGLITMAIAFNG